MKYLFITIIFIFTSGISSSQPLSGVYLVGGDSPDFSSPADAVNQLNLNGTGSVPVDFIIRDGDYLNSFEINVQGTTESLVTFRSESGIAENVTLSSEAFSDLITLSGAAYIRFVNLKLKVAGSSAINAVEITNGSNHIYIDSCIIEGSTGNLSTYAGSAVYALSSAAVQNSSHIFISNSVIKQGSFGFCADMFGATSDSIIVKKCVFQNQFAGGIFMKDLFEPSAEGNTISTNQIGNTGYNGISWDNCDGPGRILGNDIFTIGNGRANYGIELNSSAGEVGQEIIIANNSVQVQNENSLCYALAQSNNCNHYKIFHNTFYISSGSSSGSSAYQTFVFDGSTQFFNNILVNNSSASDNRCVYIANQSGMNFIDYNVYWTQNAASNFSGYFGGSENDFASYIAETGELYSIHVNPELLFTEGIGWRASSDSLLSTALFMSDFPEDIDGNLRPDPPCIGANEIDQLSTALNPDFKDNIKIQLANHQIRVSASEEINPEFILSNMQGGIIKQIKPDLKANTFELSTSDLKSGLYIFSVVTDNSMVYYKFLVP
jgi:hypothetical protein